VEKPDRPDLPCRLHPRRPRPAARPGNAGNADTGTTGPALDGDAAGGADSRPRRRARPDDTDPDRDYLTAFPAGVEPPSYDGDQAY
jgi:hypothetical protein